MMMDIRYLLWRTEAGQNKARERGGGGGRGQGGEADEDQKENCLPRDEEDGRRLRPMSMARVLGRTRSTGRRDPQPAEGLLIHYRLHITRRRFAAGCQRITGCTLMVIPRDSERFREIVRDCERV